MTGRRSSATSAVLVACLLTLALGPPVLTLLRADGYRGSVTTSFARRADVPDQLQRLLRSHRLKRRIAREVDWLPSPKRLPDFVSIEQELGAAVFVVDARGPTPEEARQLAETVAGALAPGVRGVERSTAPLADERVADRLVSALPGSAPPRPSPVWAGLAGAALALALGFGVTRLSLVA
jgi:hypothetical protein